VCLYTESIPRGSVWSHARTHTWERPDTHTHTPCDAGQGGAQAARGLPQGAEVEGARDAQAAAAEEAEEAGTRSRGEAGGRVGAVHGGPRRPDRSHGGGGGGSQGGDGAPRGGSRQDAGSATHHLLHQSARREAVDEAAAAAAGPRCRRRHASRWHPCRAAGGAGSDGAGGARDGRGSAERDRSPKHHPTARTVPGCRGRHFPDVLHPHQEASHRRRTRRAAALEARGGPHQHQDSGVQLASQRTRGTDRSPSLPSLLFAPPRASRSSAWRVRLRVLSHLTVVRALGRS